MDFAKGQEPEPVATVPWAEVNRFVIGTLERPVTKKQRQAVRGERAVRAPRGRKAYDQVFAPCAYVAFAEETAARVRGAEFALFEDAALERLLCSVGVPAREARGVLAYPVRDASGAEVGTVRRVPGGPLRRHTWRVAQPGYPEITGTGELAQHGLAGKAISIGLAATSALLNPATHAGASGKPRGLTWAAEGRNVMHSAGSKEMTLRADWFDRRLAFAFALIGDGPTPDRGAADA
ncbi:hypothetical protein B9W68_18465 [Streptomyces sp. CS227]|uniref:hypothetical protein n=1 Tax=Streptomyces sp. CS227 TaxID=1982763 RepID=UPI000B689DB4|nr:hypothetical protein [Streptomyces sp. CS227]OWA06447.1 hypothetical protein B9W68_18465 [Streptomyces sp. CS227]